MGKAFVAFVLALGIGFFVGREEMKYELRSALQDAAQSFLGALGGGSRPAPARAPAPSPKLPSPVTVTLRNKSFVPQNVQSGQFQAYQTFSIALQNTGSKDLRAISGTLQFTDLLDEPVYGINVTIDDPIKAGSSITWDGRTEYNEFIERQVRFRNMTISNLKMTFAPKKALYADGSSSEF